MGVNHRWKPAVYLVVTLPVAFQTQETGPMVTTRIIEYRQTGRPETAEVRIQIGGHVLDGTGTGEAVPIAGAWVRLERTDGNSLQTTTTNALGRFTFSGLQPGEYQLHWRAEGFPVPAAPRVVQVPSPSGEYDLRFEEN
jgi:protocatechuate 3,4-dioxygenase beta subunit